MAKTMKALSLNVETLRELTLEDAAKINGGAGLGPVSSVMPVAQPTATAVSSARPPVHHHKKHRHHHQTVSSAKPATLI